MDLDLARKLLGVDGSDPQALDAAWHTRRNQILQQWPQVDGDPKPSQETSPETSMETREHDALLANLDRAHSVLRQAAEMSTRQPETIEGTGRSKTRDIWLGVVFGLLATLVLLTLIAWLAGRLDL